MRVSDLLVRNPLLCSMLLDELKLGIETRSAAETEALGERLAKHLKTGTIALVGDLGAGKTTFAKGLAKGLGVSEPVKSPSYNVCLTYRGGLSNFAHVDAYRLKSPADFDALLLDEILPEPRLVCVEWPQIVAEALDRDAVWIEISSRAESPNIRLFRLLTCKQ